MNTLGNETCSVMAYALGVPLKQILGYYGVNNLYMKSLESKNLELVRNCCIIRQRLLSTCQTFSSSRYKSTIHSSKVDIETCNGDLIKALQAIFNSSSEYNMVAFHKNSEFMTQFEELNYTIETNLDIYLDTVYKDNGFNAKKEYIIDLFDLSFLNSYDSIMTYNENVINSIKQMNKFPFRRVINEDPDKLPKNFIIKTDKIFFDYIYKKHNDTYTEEDIRVDIPVITDISYNKMIEKSNEVGLVYIIDCENCDYTYLVSYFKSLDDKCKSSINRIILVDTDHGTDNSIWPSFSSEIGIKVEYHKYNRLIKSKSTLDFSIYILAMKILQSTKHNIVLMASDSDYWQLIQENPSRFMVGYETDKIATEYLTALAKNGVSSFNVASQCNNVHEVVDTLLTDDIVKNLNTMEINLGQFVRDFLKTYGIKSCENKEENLKNSVLEKLRLYCDGDYLRFTVKPDKVERVPKIENSNNVSV